MTAEATPGALGSNDGLGPEVPKRAAVDALMKRCQIGVGGRHALDNAHSIMAECYGTLGALMLAVERLQDEAAALRAAVAGPKGYASWQEAATSERMRRVRKEQQIETLLRGITDARCLMDPIWRERMGAEQVREHVQRGMRCITSAVTDCQFTGPNVLVTGCRRQSG